MEITLAGREYRVVAQGIGRIRRKVGTLVGIGGGEGLTGEVDDQLHDFLRTFVPDIAPLYSLLGYPSEEAYRGGEDPDGSIDEVTLPELLDAVQTIYIVNGADRLVRLGKAIGISPDLIRDVVNKEIAETSLRRSASSHAANGESGSESSSTSAATSPATS